MCFLPGSDLGDKEDGLLQNMIEKISDGEPRCYHIPSSCSVPLFDSPVILLPLRNSYKAATVGAAMVDARASFEAAGLIIHQYP